jgi:pyridoxamine 5'-phosphate oxidase
MDLEHLRTQYTRGRLEREDLDPDPLRQLEAWLSQALAENLPEPYGMYLATRGEERPSGRVVLLREISPEGLVFYTNYQSRKGCELAAHPWAAATFWWPPLERQVRVEGRVEQVPPEKSDRYFAQRPYKSRLAALASPQSEPIPSREFLEERVRELESRYPDVVPRPPHWGGYLLRPDRIEFWQGRRDRLHDRFLYILEEGGWRIERLAP